MAFVYSCCFWFSLRLGGILIGVFSLIQGSLVLIASCVAHTRVKDIQEEIDNILHSMILIYTKEYLENIRADPERYITLSTCLACVYLLVCVFYIYGAYACNNILMYGYILVELVRLAGLAVLVAVWLLVLKQNTMDIGLLIGTSVLGGFFLLGMFYLWVCAANLPVLINEMERDEQAATIARLRRILQQDPKPARADRYPLADADPYRDVFVVPSRRKDINSQFLGGNRNTIPYYR